MTSAQHVRLARVFNACFARDHHVVMVGGAAEPLYLPARSPARSIIRYRSDYAASVLHEAAHWCLAGREQRQRVDYGFWYQPPPRSPSAQGRFFAAELPVQGLECCFARAAGLDFRVSVDGEADAESRREFSERVSAAAADLGRRLPGSRRLARAHAFARALAGLA